MPGPSFPIPPLPPLILGGCQWGNSEWGTQHWSDQYFVELIHFALDHGFTALDTAWSYGGGRSEKIIGKALKGKRHGVILSSKGIPTPHTLRVQLEESLSRLGTDYLDMYFLHHLFSQDHLALLMEELLELQQEGKIRYLGISNFSLQGHDSVERTWPQTITASQNPYNLIERSAENTLLPFCRAHQIAFVSFSPLQRGLLTGKYRGHETFLSDDVRSGDPEFSPARFQRNVALVQGLSSLSKSYGKSLSQVALNWVLSRPGVSSAIVGCKTKKQIDENVRALSWSMSKSDSKRIEQGFQMLKSILELQ